MAQQLDESLGYLHKFIADLSEKQQEMHGIEEKITQFQSTLDHLQHDLEQAKSRVDQVASERQHAMESAIQDAQNATTGLADEGQQTLHKLGDVVIHTIEEKHEQ